MAKIAITENQAHQFNRMLNTLKLISKGYMTPSQLRRDSDKSFGLSYEESIEMSYENIQNDATSAAKGISRIKIPATVNKQSPNSKTK